MEKSFMTPGEMWKMHRLKVGTAYQRKTLLVSLLKHFESADTGKDYFIDLIKNKFIECSHRNTLGAKNFDYYTVLKPFPRI